MERSEKALPEIPGAENKTEEIFEKKPEKRPIEPGEAFDPETELRWVLEVPGKEREKRYAEYLEKYRFQKEGLAQMQKAVREKIKDNPETPEEELITLADQYAAEYGFSLDQLKATLVAIGGYAEKHRVVQEVLGRFEVRGEHRTDANAFFREAFFEDPVGKVEIFAAPTLIYIRCHDKRDFYQIIKTDLVLQGQKVPDFEQAKSVLGVLLDKPKVDVEKCLLAEIDGIVAAENYSVAVEAASSSRGSEEDIKKEIEERVREAFTHEEQHSVQEIFENPAGATIGNWEEIKNAETEDEKEAALIRFLKEESKVMEARAKGEIIAYLMGQVRGGQARAVIGQLERNFHRGAGVYDYYPNQAKKIEEYLLPRMGAKYKQLIESSIEKILGDRYEAIVVAGVEALEKLLGGDYSEESRERARNLLVTVPLRRWPKEISRYLGEKG